MAAAPCGAASGGPRAAGGSRAVRWRRPSRAVGGGEIVGLLCERRPQVPTHLLHFQVCVLRKVPHDLRGSCDFEDEQAVDTEVMAGRLC